MSDKSDGKRTKPLREWSREDWLTAYSEHGTVTAACKVIGISRDTAYRTRNREPEFAAAWDAAENAVTTILEKTLIEIALDSSRGNEQVRALEFALKSRRPAKYRENFSVKHTGSLTVEAPDDVDAAIRRLLGEMDRREQAAAPGGAEGAAVAPDRK